MCRQEHRNIFKNLSTKCYVCLRAEGGRSQQLFYNAVKVKVKITAEQTMKAQKECRSIALLLLQIQRYMGWVFYATFRPLYSQERDQMPIVEDAGIDPGPA
jgi:hypothetical protein